MRTILLLFTSSIVITAAIFRVIMVEAQSTGSRNNTLHGNATYDDTKGQYACARSNKTFDLSDVCNGEYTCPYLDDEYVCDNEYCSLAEFPCYPGDAGSCKPLEDICNGKSDCSGLDSFDEILCDRIDECASSCHCTSYSVSCYGSAVYIDDKNISRSTRSLRFVGISINGDNQPVSMPFNLQRYPLLLQLYVYDTGLSEVLRGDFANVTDLRVMRLSRNRITRIDDLSFSDMRKLVVLDLSRNVIVSITRNTFTGLKNLLDLYLFDNTISSLSSDSFSDLTNLKVLNLWKNRITVLPEGVFRGLTMREINIQNTGITELEPGCFEGLVNTTSMILVQNKITSLPAGVFAGVDNLKWMHLFENKISSIDVDAFRGLHDLEFIDLTNNSIVELRDGTFADQAKVTWISLSENPLMFIEPGTFKNMSSLEYLNVVNVELENLHPDTFAGITSLLGLSTDDYRLCCLFDETDLCTTASTSFLDSCSRLMPNIVLRISLWVIAWGALIGNTIVLALRCRTDRSASSKTQGLFITNLAIADFLMGVYLIIISSADVYYGEFFYLYAAKWRESITCKIAGFIAVLSSETSVFILAIITLDRVLCVVFPFGKLKFRTNSARVGVTLIWITSFVLSIVPLIVSSYVSGFYGLSDVCVGLPLNVESREIGDVVFNIEARVWEYIQHDNGTVRPSWIYSIAIFLGVNFIIFILILFSYVLIFIHVHKSARSVAKICSSSSSDQAREVKLATRMAIIVLTDFFCWMPIILMGILSQSGAVALPVSLYAWSVVFIIPINASINPYIYTFIAMCGGSKSSSTLSSKTQDSRMLETRT